MFEGREVLVTGGTGFVGRHLVGRLCAEGARVTVFVRNGSDRSVIPAGARWVEADLCRPLGAAALDAAGSAEYVVHCAALLFAGSWKGYLESNVNAARAIGKAVVAHGRSVRRVVLISSMAAAGPCGVLPGRSEADDESPVSAYGWSKLAAELVLRDRLDGIPLSILRPPVVYGPADRGLLPFFRSSARGLVACPGLRAAPVSFLHVSDLVEAVFRVLAAPAGLYHVEDGKPSSMAEFGARIARAAGRKPFMVPLPHCLVGLAAYAALAASVFCKGVFPLNPDKAREARQAGWLADGRTLRRDTGFEPRVAPEGGVQETLAWYRREGWL